jgi:hypothetical protein
MSYVSLGSPGDPEAIGDGSMIAILKRQRTLLTSILAALGAVVIASGAVAISNTPTVNQGGAPWSVSFPAAQNVICTAGCVSAGGGGIVLQGAKDVTAVPWLIDGSGVVQPVSQSGSWSMTADVSDRSARLLGVVYGSQGQQLKQTATNFNLQAETFVGGTAVDPRAIRALTSSDVVTTRLNDGAGTSVTVGQKTSANSLPVVIASDQSTINVAVTGTPNVSVTNTPTVNIAAGQSVSLGTATSKTNVLKTGSLTTTAVTADQVVLTYTVTGGKTFYLEYFCVQSRLTAVSATASILGAASLETPSGTKVFTETFVNATTSAIDRFNCLVFAEPIPVAAAAVVRVVTTPAATTSMLWIGNFGGYEK